MHIKFFLCVCWLLLAAAAVNGQADTIAVMTYNITQYGVYGSQCTSTNNNAPAKDADLRTILWSENPDIFVVNEMTSSSSTWRSRLLLNVLNFNGRAAFANAPFDANSNSNIANTVYYNTAKLEHVRKRIIPNSFRLIDWHTFYVKSPQLGSGVDTAFLHVLACHLKAGNTTADANSRGIAATNIMNAIANSGVNGNFILAGDFNMYNNNEPGWITLTQGLSNSPFVFRDPVDRVGGWSNNPAFADVHTQCPSVTSNGCYSGGGLDDRFDFILANDHVLNDSAYVRYVPGTYRAVGQDGRHFNLGISDPPSNTAVPFNVALALERASDHLPVVMKMVANTHLTSRRSARPVLHTSIAYGPGSAQLQVQGLAGAAQLRLYSLQGQLLHTQVLQRQGSTGTATLPTAGLAAGTYLLHIADETGRTGSLKMIQ